MPFLSVPPKQYGGVERMVSYLTEELVQQGHMVTLFASGDSITRARLIAPCSSAAGEGHEGHVLYSTMLGMVARYAKEFDIIHFHLNHWIVLPFVKALTSRAVVTFHMPIDNSESMQPFFQEFSDIPIVSLSDAQRPSNVYLNWQRTIYYGLPTTLYKYREKSENYYAFIGLLARHKGPDRAIDIAKAAGVRLKLAGPVYDREQGYFDQVIAPQVNGHDIEYVGPLDDAEKQTLLGNAVALLFPSQWQEPFGLVMIESMACGTPVIGFDNGSVPEVITHGTTGLVVPDWTAAVGAVADVRELDRKRCRAEFERRFLASRMCKDYVELYEALVQAEPASTAAVLETDHAGNPAR
ncbi:MAG TPA: glycosyltransferase family 4 protein [Candidatus Dormibacteraeota bacterium]|nr:glycosyltransferase family 4 protein [Candidatus Dormibacteraeota bacterium]